MANGNSTNGNSKVNRFTNSIRQYFGLSIQYDLMISEIMSKSCRKAILNSSVLQLSTIVKYADKQTYT